MTKAYLAIRAAGCALLAAALVPAGAAAAVSGPGERTPVHLPAAGPQTAHVTGGGGSLLRTIIGLAVVVAAIYGLSWVLRQVRAAKAERATGSGLATVASVPLGPGKAVHLIRAGHELLLVGASEHGVVPIRTYGEDEARAAGLLADEDDDHGAGRPPRGPGAWWSKGSDPIDRMFRRLTVRRAELTAASRPSMLDTLRAWTVR